MAKFKVNSKDFNIEVGTNTGNDTFILEKGASGAVVKSGNGNDKITAAKGTALNGVKLDLGGEGSNTVNLTSGSDYRITNGGKLNDKVSVTDVKKISFDGGQKASASNKDNITLKNVEGADIATKNGNDSITVTNISGNNIIGTGAGNDTVKVTGARGQTKINTGIGNDTVKLTNASNVSIDGEAGNDVITVSGGSNNTIVLGKGSDKLTFDFAKASGKTVIDASAYDANDVNSIIINGVKFDDLKVEGTAESIQLTKDSKTVVLNGLKFNDSKSTVKFKDGAKTFEQLVGLMNGELFGTAKADKITVNKAGLTVKAGEGNDKITVTTSNNKVYGENGKDTIEVKAANNTVFGDAGDDTITISSSDNEVSGGAGNDKITIDWNIAKNIKVNTGDTSTGMGNDVLTLKNVESTVFTKIEYNNGNKEELKLSDASGNYVIIGNWQSKTVGTVAFKDGKKTWQYLENRANGIESGSDKADKMPVKASGITVDAMGGNDTITISGSNNKVYAGEGNDKITVGGANNEVYAGNGNDTIIINTDGHKKIYAEAGNDTITVNSNNNIIYAGEGKDKITVVGGKNEIHAGEDADTIILNGGTSNQIFAGAGDDKITVDFTKVSGNTVIDLGEGKDTLTIKGVKIESLSEVKLEGDSLILASGEKVITVANWKNSAIDGITFSGKKKSRQDIEKMAQGGDPKPPADGVLDNGTWLLGTDKNDTIKASKSRYIAGKDGADTITGSEEKDYIYAGNGNDTITPGKGDDIIHTNSGDDTIIINNGDGADIIIDYGQQNTTIEFKGLTDINSLKFAVTGIVDGFTHRADLTISGYGNSNDSVSIQDFLTHTDADDYDITGYKIKVGSQVYSLLDLVNNNSDINSFSYYLGPRTPYQGNVSFETLYGTEINNTLYSVKVGEGYHSNLFGEGGDDTLYVGGVEEGASKYVGMTYIYGGKGNDTIYIDGAYNYATGAKVNTNTPGFAYGGSGNDTIYVGNGSYAYGDQYDYMNQKNRSHKVDDGDDTFYVKGISSTVEGGGGNDKIYIQQNDPAYTSYSGSDNSNNVNGGSGYNLIDASGQIAKGILNYTFSKGGNDTLIVGQGQYIIDGKARGYYKDDNDLVLLASFDNFEAGSLTIKNYYTLTEAQKENIIYAGKPDMLYYTGNKNVIDNPAFNPNNLKLGVLLEYIDLSNSTKSGKFQFAYNHDSGLRDETGITTAVYKMHQVVNSRDEVVTVPREYSHYALEAAYGGVIYKETTSNIGDNFIIGAADVAQTITGDALNDVIYGAGVGNTANAAGNTIEAGDGHDTVYGGAGADKINGGAGYDWIYGGAGNDILIGGGTDVNGFYTGDYIYGEDGNDIIYTVSETQGYVGGRKESHNYIYGGAGNDTIYANGYKDYVDGGAGNDIITVYGIGEIDGGAGDDNIIINGTAGVDAGSGNDVIDARKSTGSNGLYGGDGADVIYAGNYGDSITGGHGDDIIFGGDGDDYIIGGDDRESYLDSDIIYAGAGNDSIFVSGTSYVDAGSGDDTITVSGYSGNNYATGVTVDGGIGNDKYVIELANTCTTIYASEGKDTLVLEGYADDAKKPSITKVGNDVVISCKGNSLVILKDYYTQTSKYADWKVLDSDPSPSLIFSLTDFMKYCSGELRSTTTATNGNDFIEKNTATTFNALAGDDMVRASDSNKTVYGGAGNDLITGSKNTTYIYGDNGVEETADDGDDVIFINTNENPQNCTVYAGGGNDIINFTSYSEFCVRSVEIYGGSGNDSITVNGFISDWTSKVYGGDGDDTVYAKECALVDGGEGNNTIKCEGVRYVVCGSGNDTITGYVAGEGYSKAVVDAGNGNNIIEVNSNAIYMAGSGNDTYDVTAEYGKHKSGMIADCGTNDNDEVKFENINHDELRLVVNVQICEAGSDGATEFAYNNETKYYRVGEFACHDDGSVWESDAAYTSYYSGKDIHKHYQMAIVGEWILDKDAFLENNSDYSWYDEIDFYMNVKNSAENGFKNTALVNVEKYDSVERITFADGYYVNKTDIDGMLKKVAIALVDNSCGDVQQAMDYGNSGYTDVYGTRVDQLMKAFGSVKLSKI